MSRLFNILWKSFWTSLSALLIGLAVLVSLARLLLPMAGEYTGHVESWAGKVLGQPVRIGKLDASWRGLGPVLRLEQVQLERGGESLHFDRIDVAFDLWQSLLERRLDPSRLSLVGVKLAVERMPDNRIEIHGIELGDAVPTGEDGLSLDWMLTKQRVELLRSEVLWRDHLATGKWLRFVDVNLTQINRGRRHQAQGYLQLPEALGQRIIFAGELTGEPGTGDWSARARIQGEDLHAEGWAPALLVKGLRFQGRADFDVWVSWEQGQLQDVSGHLAGEQMKLDGLYLYDEDEAAPPLAFRSLSGRFSWQRQARGWRLDVDRFSLDCGRGSWPETGFSLAVADRQRPFDDLRAGFGWLRIDDVRTQAASFLPARARKYLHDLQPRGVVRNLNLEIRANGEHGGTEAGYRADFERLAIDGTRLGLPHLAGLRGSLHGNERQARLGLDSEKVHFSAGRLFRQAFEIDRLAGELRWQRGDEGWRLVSEGLDIRNRDIETHTRLRLDMPTTGAPVLDIKTEFANGDVATVSRYLPARIMPARTVAWLDRALVGGRIESGVFRLQGRLADFPFRKGDGVFEVKANIADAILDYHQDWPRLEELAVELRFAGPSMFIRSRAGKILQADIVRAEVDILDLKRARLDIRGRVRGGLEQGRRFIGQSPLARKLGGRLDGLALSGGMQVDLDLRIPLRRDLGAGVRTRVKVGFRQGRVAVPDWGIDLEEVEGALRYDDGAVRASDIRAVLSGQSLRLDVLHREGEDGLSIDVRGRTSAEFLRRLSASASVLQGAADWRARLEFPFQADAGDPVGLQLDSDLKGLAIDLPEPLGKRADEALPLSLSGRLGQARGVYLFRLADRAALRMALARTRTGLNLERGELLLGGGTPRLSGDQGLFVRGRLASLELTPELLARLPLISARGEPPAWLAGADVRIDTFRLYGQVYDQAELIVRRRADHWLLQVESTQASGSLALPFTPTALNPLRLDMERLALKSVAKSEKRRLPDPGRLPPVNARVADFTFNDIEFGKMELLARPVPDGLQVEKLRFASPVQQLDLKGLWYYRDGRHRSRFKIDLRGDDLGRILEQWGYAVAVKGGRVKARLSAEWAGSPGQFDLARARGRLEMKVFDGRLLDIDPGGGRIFGLLGLQTLPRRLRLDFSDLFARGFVFDDIEGGFDIRDGDAFTDDLRLAGPAAYIEVQGRTGLVARDYDQVVTVTPRLTSTLPLAGVLAGGPAAGAVMYLADRVLGKELNKLSQYRYRVTGTWENPEVERLVERDDAPEIEETDE